MCFDAVILVVMMGLLMGCGSALPLSQSQGEGQIEVQSGARQSDLSLTRDGEGSNGSIRLNLLGETLPSRGSRLEVLSSHGLGLKWIELSLDLLRSQSIRIPDFLNGNEAQVPSVYFSEGVLRIRFLTPFRYSLAQARLREAYWVGSSSLSGVRILSGEYQYERITRDNHRYIGAGHQRLSFHPHQELWFLPLSRIFSPSESSIWGDQRLSSDLHILKIQLMLENGELRSFEILFELLEEGNVS